LKIGLAKVVSKGSIWIALAKLVEDEITPSYKPIIATAENHNHSLTQPKTEGLYATMHSLAEESETDMTVPASSCPSLSPVGIVWRSLIVGVIYVLVDMVAASFDMFVGGNR